MGFPRQEYWSGLPFPPPGDLPDPGTEPMSLMSLALAGMFFTTVPLGKPGTPIMWDFFIGWLIAFWRCCVGFSLVVATRATL